MKFPITTPLSGNISFSLPDTSQEGKGPDFLSVPHSTAGRELCWDRLSGIKLMPGWVGEMGWRISVGQDGGLGERHPAPCCMCHSGEQGWWAGGVVLARHPKGCVWGSREEHLVQKEGRGMERELFPTSAQGLCFLILIFCMTAGAKSWMFFFREEMGALCAWLSVPPTMTLQCPQCAHLHRRSIKLLKKGENAQLRWSAGLSWDSASSSPG